MELQIIGINAVGYNSNLEDAGTPEPTLPLLQDDEEQLVWENWAVTYRDVIVLDGENKKVGVLNLTENSLADDENVAILEGFFLEAAGLN